MIGNFLKLNRNESYLGHYFVFFSFRITLRTDISKTEEIQNKCENQSEMIKSLEEVSQIFFSKDIINSINCFVFSSFRIKPT